ncbi:MAG: GTPase family protein, partial [Synechocystis sp.]
MANIPPFSPESELDNAPAVNGTSEETASHSWPRDVSRFLTTSGERLKTLLPLDWIKNKLLSSFWVNEAEIAEILTQLRAELPTTEALLIGKPQSGKSSIVRGLTGASAEIVGQGFQPHTQHTAQYAYPSEELPLLIFTDTVGLGDINHNATALIEELQGELGAPRDEHHPPAAKVLILTVKITDFATDTLQQIVQGLRQAHPTIPCLLVVTCLHEVYADPRDDHPPYPPDLEAINRAFAAIKANFEPWIDEAVMIDFTREEDGYDPVFYGLTTLRDRLAARLPAAEAQTLHQLLDGETGKRLGSIYRDVARRYILAFSVMAGTLAAVPLPFATMPVLTTLQISLVGLLGQLYGQV